MDGIEVLNSGQAGENARAGITDGKENVKYYDFENVTSDHKLEASFKAIQTGGGEEEEIFYTITASAGTGGSVSPSGEVKVKSGENQQFTITPEEGYQINSILVDGIEALNSGQAGENAKAGITDGKENEKYYEFENVTSDHTLEASFKAIDTEDKDPDVPGGGDNDDDKEPDVPGGGGNGGDKKPDVPGGGSTNGDSSSDSSSGNNSTDDSGSSVTVVLSDMNVRKDAVTINTDNTAPASNEKEPKTGDASHTEIYATTAMIAGVSYMALYFADRRRGMTEEEKKEIVAALVKWAKKGKRVRRYVALAVIFLVLVYYHSIGKRTLVNWKAIYVK